MGVFSQREDRLLRLKQVLEIVPVGKSTWWAGVATGRFPQPLRHLGPRITVWKASEVYALVTGEV
jgi:predicted DNA-binding transcriptional regulator AlpA